MILCLQAWEKVDEVLSGLPPSNHPPLTITAGRLLVMKRNEKEEEGSKIKVTFVFFFQKDEIMFCRNNF